MAVLLYVRKPCSIPDRRNEDGASNNAFQYTATSYGILCRRTVHCLLYIGVSWLKLEPTCYCVALLVRTRTSVITNTAAAVRLLPYMPSYKTDSRRNQIQSGIAVRRPQRSLQRAPCRMTPPRRARDLACKPLPHPLRTASPHCHPSQPRLRPSRPRELRRRTTEDYEYFRPELIHSTRRPLLFLLVRERFAFL